MLNDRFGNYRVALGELVTQGDVQPQNVVLGLGRVDGVALGELDVVVAQGVEDRLKVLRGPLARFRLDQIDDFFKVRIENSNLQKIRKK